MNEIASRPAWATAAILIGRLIFAALFVMAVSFKLLDPSTTAGQIAAAGFTFGAGLLFAAACGPGRVLALNRSVI